MNNWNGSDSKVIVDAIGTPTISTEMQTKFRPANSGATRPCATFIVGKVVAGFFDPFTYFPPNLKLLVCSPSFGTIRRPYKHNVFHFMIWIEVVDASVLIAGWTIHILTRKMKPFVFVSGAVHVLESTAPLVKLYQVAFVQCIQEFLVVFPNEHTPRCMIKNMILSIV